MGEGTAAGDRPGRLSVCLFCGSSEGVDPAFMAAARAFGRILASEGVRLVYGGGGIGLMGAAARGAQGAGGAVLGVMPEFLRRQELLYDEVETVVVRTMHERKRIMFEQSDAFAVFPGGVGTLEEVVELLSWRRLELHAKPIVFLDHRGFWRSFFELIRHTAEAGFSPPWAAGLWRSVETVDAVLPAIRSELAAAARPDAAQLARRI